MSSDTEFLDGVTADSDSGYGRTEQKSLDEATARLASTLTARHADRHYCGLVGCRHRNHGRDEAYRRLMLEALDLPDEGARRSDYGGRISWHSLSHSETQAMMGKPPQAKNLGKDAA